LSQPVTKTYFERVKNDLFWDAEQTAHIYYYNRGQLLSDCVHLDVIEVERTTKEGKEIFLWCCS
jgi:hypothetical protein